MLIFEKGRGRMKKWMIPFDSPTLKTLGWWKLWWSTCCFHDTKTRVAICVCVSTEGEKGRSMGWSALPSLGENGWSMVGLIVGAETGEIVFSWVAHKSMKLRFSPSSLHHHLSSQMIGFERFLEMISISVRVDRRGFSRSLNPTELLVFSFDRPFLLPSFPSFQGNAVVV